MGPPEVTEEPTTHGAVIGREPELAAVVTMLDAVPHGPVALLLEGEAGIGKTTILEAALAGASARGYRVLRCQPTRSERWLSFAAVADLLAHVPPEEFVTLPAPQRHALDIALLRAEPDDDSGIDVRVVGAACVSLLYALAARAPAVVAVDDVQWLDAPSARVLEFALRRLHSNPVGIITAARAPDVRGIPLGLDRALPDSRRRSVTVAPLSLAALHQVLRAHLGRSFARPVLVRIAETSGGNPLFALEVAAALLRSNDSPTAEDLALLPENLRDVLIHRTAQLPVATRRALLVVAATAHPSPAMIRSVIDAPVRRDVLAPAVRAGIVEIDGSRIRFTHPLLASAVYAAAPESERRSVHRGLSAVVEDVEQRARHRGLGVDGPDSDVARELSEAAHRAWSRGAADTAAELARRARLLTPPERAEDLHRRTLAESDFLRDAEDLAGAAGLLHQLVEGLTHGTVRAEVLWRLGDLERDAGSPAAGLGRLVQALDEVGDDVRLRATVERDLAWAINVDQASRALHARRAAELAEGTADPGLLNEALTVHAFAEFLAGRGFRRDLIDRATRNRCRTDRSPASRRPGMIHAFLLRFTDDLDAARVRYEAEHRRLLDLGVDTQLPDLLWHMSELETWAGSWLRAEQYASQCYETAMLSGRPPVQSWALYVCALIDAHRGRVTRARAKGEEGLAVAIGADFPGGAFANLRVLGFLELSLGNAAEAYAHLERIAAASSLAVLPEPSLFRYLPDAVEALVGLGRLDEAAGLLDPFEAQGVTLGRSWAIAAAARCRGLLAAARGDLAAAGAALETGVVKSRQLPYPFELARSLLVKGEVHRRAQQKRAARDALAEALDGFERLGAPLWAEKARAELGRIGLRPRASVDLTATEQRVAELAATGLTNREIARSAFLSHKSVEGVLGRVYTKLGIRSRAELGTRMAARRVGPPGR